VFEGDEPEWEVESILNHQVIKKGKNKGVYYLIRWAGYSKEFDTWEPEENLTNCEEAIQEYKKDHKVSK
jgi:hypothetical protein